MDARFIITFTYLITFWVTNFFILLLSSYLTATSVKVLIIIRDLFIILLLLLNVPSKLKLRLNYWPWLGLMIIWVALALQFLLHPQVNKAVLIYTRNLTLPWLFAILGMLQGEHSRQIQLTRTLHWFRTALVIFGALSIVLYIGRHIFLSCYAMELFAKITMKTYYDPKFCLLKNAVSFDLYKYTKWGVPRLFGLVIDPPIAGIILSASSVFLFLKRPWPWLELIPIAALVLTLSKGAYYIFVTYILLATIILLGRKLHKRKTIKILNLLTSLAIIFLLLLPYLDSVKLTKSITNHLEGLENGLNVMLSKPLGAGLGTYGNFAPEWTPVRESFLGAIAAQLGILGFVGYAILLLGTLRQAANALKEDKLLIFLLLLFFFIFLTSAFLSESTITMSGGSFIFYLTGLAYGIMPKNK